MVDIIQGTSKSPVVAGLLKKIFSNEQKLSGILYIGYPIINTANQGSFFADAMYISHDKGIVLFNFLEEKNIKGYKELQDQCANIVDSRLRQFPELTKKRELLVNINVITYAPAVTKINNQDSDYPLCTNDFEIISQIDSFDVWNDSQLYEKTISVIQSMTSIKKNINRFCQDQTSRGAKLTRIENSIAILDREQSKAVIETVDGVQRIRGLAGSGKTIVLAAKVAYLHSIHPDWKICVTFNTRSLKDLFRTLVNSFYIEQNSSEPDWNNIHIIHAWGSFGSNNTGLYYKFCTLNDIDYLDLKAAKLNNKEDPFGYACIKAIADSQHKAQTYYQVYDVILVDEAQDFNPAFLKLCYKMLKDPKRLIYAYDELQKLNADAVLPPPEKIFGEDANGKPNVVFDRSNNNSSQDIILNVCYRNSRLALITAHALGFGIYRKRRFENDIGLIQMFDSKELWTEIGYKSEKLPIEEGKEVIFYRDDSSSPKFLEDHSEPEDLVLFRSFKSQDEQDQWVCKQIIQNIQTEELKENDIAVISPEPLTARKKIAHIQTLLFNNNIRAHIVGVDSSTDSFFSQSNDSVALSGIYRAKGNEAAMVYIVNAESCFGDSLYSLVRVRNQLFTAITRSRAWVRVLGVGPNMDLLISEFKNLEKHQYKLDFTYPTAEERNRLKIINRDIGDSNVGDISQKSIEFSQIIQSLEDGRLSLDDLNQEDIKKLKELLKK